MHQRKKIQVLYKGGKCHLRFNGRFRLRKWTGTYRYIQMQSLVTKILYLLKYKVQTEPNSSKNIEILRRTLQHS